MECKVSGIHVNHVSFFIYKARDNVSNFIDWCRHQIHIREVLLFETEDLVLQKNEKNVILCIMEVSAAEGDVFF